MLVERAMRTWTRAADGRFTLEKMATTNDAAVLLYRIVGKGETHTKR